MTTRKSAVVYVETVAVLCRECGELQPDPASRSLFWTVEQLQAAFGTTLQCVACDVSVAVVPVRRALIAT